MEVLVYWLAHLSRFSRPDLPGVIDAHQRNIYPTDLLIVAPNQRVKINTKEVVEALIKACFTLFEYIDIIVSNFG